MDDLLSVDVADPLQYLLGEDTASLLRENKLIFNHPVKKLPASNAARCKRDRERVNFGRKNRNGLDPSYGGDFRRSRAPDQERGHKEQEREIYILGNGAAGVT